MSTMGGCAPTALDYSSLCNSEAEYSLLCVLLRDRATLEAVADRLHPDDFVQPFLGRVFGMLVAEASAGREANLVSIKPTLELDPDYGSFGGWPAFVAMTGAEVLLYDWKGLAGDLLRLSRRRRIIDSMHHALALAADATVADDALAEAVDAIGTASDGNLSAEDTRAASYYADAYMASLDAPNPPGVTCGSIPSLDAAIGPLRPSNLVVAAGRPGMGKTAGAISYAVGAARKGFGVLFVTIEMGGGELIERVLADMCFDGPVPVAADRIRDRSLTRDEIRAVSEANNELRRLPLYLRDTPRMTPNKLDRVIRRFKRRIAAKGGSLDLVIVDYLQLMSADGEVSGRYEAVTAISNGLKRVAKTHNLPVLALAQLSRAVESRPDKIPQMSDLKESGSIEQDADTIVFFFRPEYYLGAAKPDDEDSAAYLEWSEKLAKCAGGIEFRCEKRRAGKSNVYLRGEFHAEYQAVR